MTEEMTNTKLAWEEIKLYQFLNAENVVDFVFLHCNCRETISLISKYPLQYIFQTTAKKKN